MASLIEEPLPGSFLEIASKYVPDIVSQPQLQHRLVRCMRLAKARFTKNRVIGIAGAVMEEMGIEPDEEQLIATDPFFKVASAIVAEAMMKELVASDLRSELFGLYRERTMTWFQNMNQIASGEADPGGERPIRRDQIEAFKALRNDPMARFFDTTLMMDQETDDNPEMQHLNKQKQLLSGAVMRVEGEVVNP